MSSHSQTLITLSFIILALADSISSPKTQPPHHDFTNDTSYGNPTQIDHFLAKPLPPIESALGLADHRDLRSAIHSAGCGAGISPEYDMSRQSPETRLVLYISHSTLRKIEERTSNWHRSPPNSKPVSTCCYTALGPTTLSMLQKSECCKYLLSEELTIEPKHSKTQARSLLSVVLTLGCTTQSLRESF